MDPRETVEKDIYTLHLIAGATGDLLHRLATVAATQFSNVEFQMVAHSLKDDLTKVQAVLDKIEGPHTIVLHALPGQTAKEMVRSDCVNKRIPHFDATGPLLDFFADCVGSLPDNDLSRLHQHDATYQQRIEAMEYALQHDDGLGLTSLVEADVVIVGVSRVSKSPTTLYLSSRGVKAANVSVSLEVGFPDVLDQIDQQKIIAFTSQPKKLQAIRAERLERAGVGSSDYDDLRSVIREVMDSEAEYERRGYTVIDVTDLTIEQTAAMILSRLNAGEE